MNPVTWRALLAASIAFGIVGCGNSKNPPSAHQSAQTPVHTARRVPAPLSTEQIAAKVLPSVVTLHITDKDALGSGVLVDSKGRVLTCDHVIKDGSTILARMSDGGFFPVTEVAARDSRLDLAVVTLKGKSLPSLTLANSSTIKSGQKVVAIGSPQGLENTVTEGIVSAVRTVADFPKPLRDELVRMGRKDTDTLIQFTAPISPGNSGGPLVNTQAEVIGIVAMSLPSADSIYFAIPVNEAKGVLSGNNMTQEPIPSKSGAHYSPSGYSPKVGEMVTVTTPKGIGLNLREEASQYSGKIAGRELVRDGETIEVLDRAGDWLLIRTSDGYRGYARWRYEGTVYVSPSR